VARAIALVGIILLAGCGGAAKDDRSSSQPNARQPEQARKVSGETENDTAALRAIPRADRHAFVQIAVATGDLNTAASVLSITGIARRRDAIALRRLRSRVLQLHPRAAALRRLRGRLLTLLETEIRARRSPSVARRSVTRTLAGANEISDSLKRYEASHPAIRVLVPD
jgi:hypothetical protein